MLSRSANQLRYLFTLIFIYEATRRLYCKAFEEAFVYKLPSTICKINGWNSPTSKQFAIFVGAVAYVLWMVLLCVYVNYEALLLGVKIKNVENINIGIKVAIVSAKLLIDFISSMGSVYSEIEEKKEQARRYEEQRQLVTEQTRRYEEQRRRNAEQMRHNIEQKVSMDILIEHARKSPIKDQTIVNIIQQHDAQSYSVRYTESTIQQMDDAQEDVYRRMGQRQSTENTQLLG